MKITKKLLTLVVVLFTLLGTSQKTFAAADKFYMVLFVPSDQELPENYKERYKFIYDYAQSFYNEWMPFWGYPVKDPIPVEMDENNYPKVYTIKGENGYDFYDLKKIKAEVKSTMISKYNIDIDENVVFIQNYPERKRSSRGGGKAYLNGFSFSNYVETDSDITLDMELSDPIFDLIKFKSVIHEMGHSFGMGHVGPKEKVAKGNSLMGPVSKSYKKKFSNINSVYLSEMAAAQLWKHPLFTITDKEMEIPTAEIKSVKIETIDGTPVITGEVKSDQGFHSVTLLDAPVAVRSEYLHKGYVDRVESGNKFKIEVTEPLKSGGIYKIAICFNNGVVAGICNGSKIDKYLEVKYNYNEGEYSIVK